MMLAAVLLLWLAAVPTARRLRESTAAEVPVNA
jgi:hypothetical protein